MKGTIIKLLCFLSLCFIGNASEANGPYEPNDRWASSFLTQIEAMPDLPSSEEILTLASLSANESTNRHVKLVKEKAWQRLTSIPHFADLLIRRVQEQREKWISGKQAWTVYDGERMRTLRHMGKLKHPEIVRVMGNLLPDLEVPGDDGTLQIRTVPPNGVLAARALGQLIESPPLGKDWESYRVDDVATWQLWFEQVKAGTRTFRFKGDPQEYNLQGPVSGAATPAGAKPSLSPAAGPKKGGAPRGVPKLALIASSVVLGLAVVFLLRGRRRKPV